VEEETGTIPNLSPWIELSALRNTVFFILTRLPTPQHRPHQNENNSMFSAISSYIFAVEEEVLAADGFASSSSLPIPPTSSSSSSSTTLDPELEPAPMVKVKRLQVTIGGDRVNVEIANVNDPARPTEIDT